MRKEDRERAKTVLPNERGGPVKFPSRCVHVSNQNLDPTIAHVKKEAKKLRQASGTSPGDWRVGETRVGACNYKATRLKEDTGGRARVGQGRGGGGRTDVFVLKHESSIFRSFMYVVSPRGNRLDSVLFGP